MGLLVSPRDLAHLEDVAWRTEVTTSEVISGYVTERCRQIKESEVSVKCSDFHCEEIRNFLRDLDKGNASSSDARETVVKVLNAALSKAQPDGLSMQERFAASAGYQNGGGL